LVFDSLELILPEAWLDFSVLLYSFLDEHEAIKASSKLRDNIFLNMITGFMIKVCMGKSIFSSWVKPF